MKCALIFPPQWDPRQPHLNIPTLTSILKSKGNEVKAWDVNLYLYWQIILSKFDDHRFKKKFKEYFNPENLKDLKKFSRISTALECEIYLEYDNTENHQLYWDNLVTPYSCNKSEHWKIAAKTPTKFPYFKWIKPQIEEIILWKPDIVFISCISDSQIFSALSIASLIRKKLPNIKIVVGGHAFIQRKSLFKKQKWLFSIFDAICLSNGESTIIALSEGKPLNQVPNILWLNKDVVEFTTAINTFKFDESYEADFSLLPLSYYLTPALVIPIETARGCPWSKCAFCDHPKIDLESNLQVNNQRSIVSIIKEIDKHYSCGINKFFFVDEALSFERFRRLSFELTKMDKDLSWICYLRLEHSHTLETFRLAKQAGCRKIFFGLETGSDRILTLYQKGTASHIAKRIIQDANTAGIALHFFLITGFPDESKNDRSENEKFLKEVIPYIDSFGFSYDIFPLTVALNAPIYLNPEYYGAIFKKNYEFDLASRLSLENSREKEIIQSQYNKRIKQIIEDSLKKKEGIRRYRFSNDSMHLLLIENYSHKSM
jgi:anaerobic magnesium-protoporphyrin IX monomethyl ester cyclase